MKAWLNQDHKGFLLRVQPAELFASSHHTDGNYDRSLWYWGDVKNQVALNGLTEQTLQLQANIALYRHIPLKDAAKRNSAFIALDESKRNDVKIRKRRL